MKGGFFYELMRITVGKNGDYRTVKEAVEAVLYDDPSVIEIDEGVYREKIFIEKKDITLKGAGIGKTVIEYGDGAKDMMPDGSRRGTFRSETLFLGGERCRLCDLSVRNTAGTGMEAGQALAVYADSTFVYMENVELTSHQDTLFMAPLPTSVRQPGGFFGPRMLSDRKPTYQYYKNCVIKGDVDFIFGGADALFEDCEIIACDLKKEINGYITAPSENLGNIGLVFKDCLIHGETQDMEHTVFLGRPWRPEGKAAFLSCRYDECIHPLRFSEWGELSPPESRASFCEYDPMDPSGKQLDVSGKNSWVRALNDSEAAQILEKADVLKSRFSLS